MKLPAMPNLGGASTPTPPHSSDRLLSDLAVGSVAMYSSCQGESAASGVEESYLAALGLYPGSELRVCKVGEPWIVEVDHTRVALSAPLARRMRVGV